MWEVPRYRIRAYLRQLKKERSTSYRQRRSSVHFKKTRAQISVTEGFGRVPEIINCSIVLNDLDHGGVWLFSSQPLLPGQAVKLTLQHPRAFYVSGVVTSSTQALNSYKVISKDSSFPYRVHILFRSNNTDELVDIRRFVQEIRAIHLYPVGNA